MNPRRSWIAASLTVALAAGGACYSPELHDCTLSCATSADCAGGQVCGADKLCAAPATAGRCEQLATAPDAGVPHDAGPARPDAATPDAP
ncbi:MAG TPA: hypothetical protein VFP84_14145, partial [Kofleriaceae bacterium]|nr:hypothetical protein [Kofleriaceae bacterium]